MAAAWFLGASDWLVQDSVGAGYGPEEATLCAMLAKSTELQMSAFLTEERTHVKEG